MISDNTYVIHRVNNVIKLLGYAIRGSTAVVDNSSRTLNTREERFCFCLKIIIFLKFSYFVVIIKKITLLLIVLFTQILAEVFIVKFFK